MNDKRCAVCDDPLKGRRRVLCGKRSCAKERAKGYQEGYQQIRYKWTEPVPTGPIEQIAVRRLGQMLPEEIKRAFAKVRAKKAVFV